MDEKMPRTPFSTALSGSARELEIRLRNIFSGQKKRPPLLLFLLLCAIALSCGDLVSCRRRPAVPVIVMDTQYYDSFANYLEIPMLALPAGEQDDAVDLINAGLAQLREKYDFIEENLGVSQRCILYPSTTDRYISLVFFEDASDYGNDGNIQTWVYDKKERAQVTGDEALALAGTSLEALFGQLEVLIAADPEDPRGLYPQTPDPIVLLGFRMKADGQPVFYLSAYVDARDMGEDGYLDEWARLYVWDSGTFSRYSCRAFQSDGQYPLVPAEETDQMDPPLWNQWYFAGGEPAGGFVDKLALAADYAASRPVELYDPEVALIWDGGGGPIGPPLSLSASPLGPLTQTSEVLHAYETHWEGDYWYSADGEGFLSTNYYGSASGTDSLYLLDVSRMDLATPRGIRVGDSREDVLAAYPEIHDTPYWDYVGDYLWYCDNEEGWGSAIIFFLYQDQVTSIQLHNMFD